MYDRAVIFDLDDTLYPLERFVRSGLAAVAQYVERQFGVPAGQALMVMLKASALGGATEFQALCRSCHVPEDAVPGMISVYRSHTPSLWLFHDAEATLRELRAHGWRLAILTNGFPQVQAIKVDALGLRSLVDEVVFAADHAEGGKPHAAAFHEVCRRVGLTADRCVMVGDNPDCDIRGGREAGLRTVHVVRNHAPVSIQAEAMVTFLGEVPRAAELLVPKVSAHAA